MLSRFTAAAILAFTLIASATLATDPLPVKRPNIVLLFMDDLGWADLGYGNPVLESPNIDRLARQGVDFEQAYITSPTCSPSRTALLTGKYAARFQMLRHVPSSRHELGFDDMRRTNQEFHNWPGDPAKTPSRNWLPNECVTYATALRQLGYYTMHTMHLGKWHLGHEPYYPIHHGFDAQVGMSNFGMPDSYYPPYFTQSNPFPNETGRYLTDKLTDDAVKFIESYDRPQPFLLSFWYYAVHRLHLDGQSNSHQGRKDLVRHFEEKGLAGDYAQYAAMIADMDESVGRVQAALEQKGLNKNTVILFLSDQGGCFQNGPLRGNKDLDSVCEGGCRVRFIVCWPGVSDAGKSQSIVSSLDVFPTLIEIAGGDVATLSGIDGTSLVPALRHNTTLDRARPIFIYLAYEDQYAAVRDGNWKLIAYRSSKRELYNLADDVGEKQDLAKTQPARVQEMSAQLLAWESDMGLAKILRGEMNGLWVFEARLDYENTK